MPDQIQQAVETNSTDAIKRHVERMLQEQYNHQTAVLDKIAELRGSGHLVVTGGQTTGDEWEIRDQDTNNVVAAGSGGRAGYEAAYAERDPGRKWVHVDTIGDQVAYGYVQAQDLPESLARYLEEWLEQPTTADKDIAWLVGWPVEKVSEYRAD